MGGGGERDGRAGCPGGGGGGGGRGDQGGGRMGLILQFVGRRPNVHNVPDGMVSEVSACSAGDPDSTPGSERSLGEGNGCPPQYSCLGNPMDRKAWWATALGAQRVRHDLVTNPPCLLQHYLQ